MKIGLDELTGTEQAVLLVLMAQARPVPNPEMERLGPVLTKQHREHLNRVGLVESIKAGPRFIHELTDDGWALCRDLIAADAPERSSGQGKALYTVMRALKGYLDRADLPLAEVFTDVAAGPADKQRVQEAYHRLAPQPGEWVSLARLRALLPDVAPGDLDDTLRRMYRKPGVHLIPEENQKVLGEHDWDAAVVIGDQHKHLIAIES